MADLLKQATFFKTYNVADDALDKTGLVWADLQNIHEKHSSNIANLEATATYIAERLRQLDEVHSLKIRIKHPEHLIEKIIRKKLDDPTLDITPENYGERITDLIGIRALHLFKEDWERIHDFIIETWGLHEAPTANVRKGDAEEVTKLFTDKGCVINEHKFGYRSVHYLVQSQPSRDLFIAELQVRTIFEEGWSEIDHRIRYPYDLENIVLAQFLVMFNRLAGSADEMGSFIKFLKKQLEMREEEHQRVLSEHDKKINDLNAEIQKLRITQQKKEELEERVKSLSSTPVQQSGVFGLAQLVELAPIQLSPWSALEKLPPVIGYNFITSQPDLLDEPSPKPQKESKRIAQTSRARATKRIRRVTRKSTKESDG